MSGDSSTATALAIADLLNRDTDLVDQIEGRLLMTGGSGETVIPAEVARETGMDREIMASVFRQLEDADTVRRTSRDDPVIESPYRVRRPSLRALFTVVRQSIPVIEAHIDRQPPKTEIEPLVTFPDDPAFASVAPRKFGMSQLMSALATEIKDTTDSIILVAPFFEADGFKRVREVLANALERGVTLTIVTRYLTDTDSYNYEVIEDFVQYLADERGVARQVRTIDYTVWDDEVPASRRTQDGARPAFTLHAKIMLFDSKAAYIGSANVTDYGFGRYLELGVLLRGAQVEHYRDLCEYLLESGAATTERLI